MGRFPLDPRARIIYTRSSFTPSPLSRLLLFSLYLSVSRADPPRARDSSASSATNPGDGAARDVALDDKNATAHAGVGGGIEPTTRRTSGVANALAVTFPSRAAVWSETSPGRVARCPGKGSAPANGSPVPAESPAAAAMRDSNTAARARDAAASRSAARRPSASVLAVTSAPRARASDASNAARVSRRRCSASRARRRAASSDSANAVSSSSVDVANAADAAASAATERLVSSSARRETFSVSSSSTVSGVGCRRAAG